jgi:outer membrane protein assembly factor BamB
MKRPLIAFLMLLMFFPVLAARKIVVQSNKTFVGVNLNTGHSIQAVETVFPMPVYQTFQDATLNTLSIELRKVNNYGVLSPSGKYLVYDTMGDSLLWTRKIYYNRESINENDSILLLSSLGKMIALNKRNGTECWHFDGELRFVDWERKQGIFEYKPLPSQTERRDIAGCVDLTNGNCNWTMDVETSFGWNEMVPISEKEVLFSAGGLHLVNWENGEGWDYKAKTGKNDFARSFAVGMFGIGLGLLTGTYLIPIGHDVLSDMNSNVCLLDSAIYYASREEIVCLDRMGHVNWKQPLVKADASQSVLFAVDSAIYLLNKGTAFLNGRQILRGQPFLRKYDARNGNVLYQKEFNENQFVRDWSLKGTDLYIGSNEDVMHFDLSGSPKENLWALNSSSIGGFSYFLSDVAYVLKDSVYQSITEVDSVGLYFYVAEKKVIHTDSELNLLDSFDGTELYQMTQKQNGLRFLHQNGKTMVIDESGKAVAQLDCGRYISLFGNSVCWIRGNSFFRTDLTPFLRK